MLSRERRPSEQDARLLKVCRARGLSREDARDLLQEAHMRLIDYQRSGKVWDADSLLRRIVVNLSINHYHRVLSVPYVCESAERLDKQGMLIDPAAGPERTLAAEQELYGVVKLVLAAESKLVCLILLAQRAGYSYEEIAAAFALKPRTVEKHVGTAAEVIALTTGS